MKGNLVRMLQLAGRMTWRDFRAGELTWLLCALLLCVAALSSVFFLSDRLTQALNRDATQLIAADLRIASDTPIPPAFIQVAEQRKLRTALTANFPSMVRAAAAGHVTPSTQVTSLLAAIKAVSSAYPLRGQLTISDSALDDGKKVVGGPSQGQVWVDGALLSALQLKLGDDLLVGERSLRISKIIVQELDRGASFLNFAPRVMMHFDDLPSTGLITLGSRVSYRLLLAEQTKTLGANNPLQAISAYQAELQQHITQQGLRGIEIETLENGPPQVKSTLDRAERFLSLVALLTVMMSSVAIALAMHHFMVRHLDTCALYKCLGLSGKTLLGVFLLEFLGLGLLAAILGTAVGYGIHLGMLGAVGDLVTAGLPAASWKPWLIGTISSLALLSAFATPPLMRLAKVSPIQVLRRAWLVGGALSHWQWLWGVGVLFALIIWSASSIKLGATIAAGFAAAVGVFAGCAWGCLQGLNTVLKRYGARLGSLQRLALSALMQRKGMSILQIVSLAMGLMTILILGITRQDLMQGWRASAPPDAPNRFILNILPEQKQAVQNALTAVIKDTPLVSPMIRGRLTHINDAPVVVDSYADERAKRLVDREFNLSYATNLPQNNRVVLGKWFGQPAAGAAAKPEISMEEGIAKTLNLKLGDRLRYEVAGQTIEAPITSLRKLDWSSMQVNFFVLLPVGTLDGFPETWITSVHFPNQTAVDRQAASRLESQLVAQNPNLTIINTESILKQVQGILDKVIAAVELLFLFTLVAGVLVWMTGLMSSAESRARDAAILRALGASSRHLKMIQRIEQASLGALAGLLAAIGASLFGWVLARFVFEFTYTINLWVFPLSIGLGVLGAWLASLMGLRGILTRPAVMALRNYA